MKTDIVAFFHCKNKPDFRCTLIYIFHVIRLVFLDNLRRRKDASLSTQTTRASILHPVYVTTTKDLSLDLAWRLSVAEKRNTAEQFCNSAPKRIMGYNK